MKIVISGASGYVGRQLVPLLLQRGLTLLLAGRDPEKLARLFPGIAHCGYDELPEKAAGHDMFLHLAVLNNDADKPSQAFHAINVVFLLEMLDLARAAGIPCFVNISSTHALGTGNDAYSTSKRQAAVELGRAGGIETRTIYLPLVYGEDWPRRLAFLDRLPKRMAQAVFQIVGALRPTVHIRKLADHLCAGELLDGNEEFILSDRQEGNVIYQFVKRSLDLLIAITFLLLFWWLLLAIWLLIRMGSKGPGIYAQMRIGLGGQPFTFYKFRTMEQGTVQAATHEVSASSVTRIGRFLRKSKLDELPQLFNIVRNELSLVGPRPCLPTQKELIRERKKRAVLEMKPGLTGLAQINGIAMDDPRRLAQWDARYMALRSIPLDLRIILATALGRGSGDQTNRKSR